MLRKTVLMVFAALLLNACVSFPSGSPWKRDLDSETHERIRALTKKTARILYLIQKHALKDMDINKCFDQIIPAGLNECLDEHAVYFDQDMLELMETDEYVGIGITVKKTDSGFEIIELAEGPARQAGLAEGDIVVAVNGVPMAGKPLIDFSRALDGKEGTEAALRIRRQGAEFETSVKRTEIIVPVIHYNQFGAIGYMRIAKFTPAIYRDLPPLINDLLKSSAILMDLRDNPGGYLNWTIFVTELFARRDDLILTVRKRNNELDWQRKAQKDGVLAGKPLVILINQRSASSSEIVAGALRELGRVVLIGEKSRGKGTAQTTFPLKDGTKLKLTTHEFFVGPKEKTVHGIGVVPDMEIKQPAPGNLEDQVRRFSYKIDPAADAQLKKALEFLGYDESNTSSP